MSCDSDKRKCKLGCLPGYQLQSSSRWLTSSAWNRAERREERREEERRGGGEDGWRPGAGCRGADLGLSRGEGLAQGFRFAQELNRERSRERFGNGRAGQG